MEATKEKPTGRTVLLFSGGMDSYLTYRLYRPDVLLYCAIGHRYQGRERAAMMAITESDPRVGGILTLDYSLALSQWEREDAIIPLRNLLFAAVASRFGDTVMMGSLKGENIGDKSPEFYTAASEALTRCYGACAWCEGRTVRVYSPCCGFTKAQLLRAALAAGVTRAEVGLTVSCYSPQGFCGQCYSCFKRAVATKANGWVEDYEHDPFDTGCGRAALARAQSGQYPEDKAAEIMGAYEKV